MRTWQFIGLLEHLDNTSVINSSSENGEEVVEKHRLLFEVEIEGLNETKRLGTNLIWRQQSTHLVVDFDVGDFDYDLLELIVIPGICSSLHHGESCVVEFVVMNVEEHEFRPKVSLLGGTKNLGDV